MSKYLENSWYCIAWADELEKGPVGKTIIEKPVVVYRTEGGELVAMGGACPHRFAPLAQGKVCGDSIACPYHGLVFDKNGQCTHNPHGDGIIPPSTMVDSYIAVEKLGAIWVWLGDPEQADDTTLFDSDWIDSSEYVTFTGQFPVHAHYQLVVDNLLDLTHAPYLHPTTLATPPEENVGLQHDFKVDPDGTIHSQYFNGNIPKPSPQIIPIWGERPADFSFDMRWRPASVLEFDIYVYEVGGEDRTKGLHQPSYHFLTPVNDKETLYFFAAGRNMKIDDEEVSMVVGQMAAKAFGQEDEPMIRACQEMMGTSDLMSLKPKILGTDAAAVMARRVVKNRMEKEQPA